jgi:hypothetical protein
MYVAKRQGRCLLGLDTVTNLDERVPAANVRRVVDLVFPQAAEHSIGGHLVPKLKNRYFGIDAFEVAIHRPPNGVFEFSNATLLLGIAQPKEFREDDLAGGHKLRSLRNDRCRFLLEGIGIPAAAPLRFYVKMVRDVNSLSVHPSGG